MKKFIGITLIVLTVAGALVVYFLHKEPEKKKENILIAPDPNAQTARGSGPAPLQRWVVVGSPDGQGYCKMGQAKIWDGTKWVCCIHEANA